MNIRKEGDEIKSGFNFYPLSDPSSFGFIYKYNTGQFNFRYSKITKKWMIGNV